MVYPLLFFIFFFGLIIGSFLNCLIWRLHKDETVLGRSYCPHCRHQLAWYDNVPILSYVALKGKCRYCGKSISWQYPAVELVTGLLFLGSFIFNLQAAPALDQLFAVRVLRDWLVVSVMVIIFIYDLRWYLILDKVTFPAMAAVAIFNLVAEFGAGGSGQVLSWRNWVISGIIGGSFFLLQFIATKGRGIGGGDLRLGLLMGLILGWQGLIVAFFAAYFSGSIVGLSLIAAGKKQWGSKLPFGVFLAPATIVALFWGQPLWQWFSRWLY
ncbi:prepilin peptidase [Candidatus Falkowbacteria bacterium]|nr:prepilin peptidase [Candidatus Falkowbacteria bacterium]